MNSFRDESVLQDLLKRIKPEHKDLVKSVAIELANAWDSLSEEEKLKLVANSSCGSFVYEEHPEISGKLGKEEDLNNLLIDPEEDWFEFCEELLEEYAMPNKELDELADKVDWYNVEWGNADWHNHGDPDIDDLLDEAQDKLSEDEYVELYHQIQDLIKKTLDNK